MKDKETESGPPVCQKCKQEYHMAEFDDEPTPFCHPCAHEVAGRALDALETMTKAQTAYQYEIAEDAARALLREAGRVK